MDLFDTFMKSNSGNRTRALENLSDPDCPLSEEQASVAREIIDTGSNFLITGNAGTGKSFLLNWLRENLVMSVTASTGVAALQIKGETIHSWSGIGVGAKTPAQVVANLWERKQKWNDKAFDRIANCNVLVIDEISMLSARMLDLIDDVLRLIHENDEPFGGIQMVFVGDMLQLPPVSKGDDEEDFSFNAESWIAADVQVRLLTKVFRQEEEHFARVLNKIRFEITDDEVYEFLYSRFNAVDEDPDHPPCILHTHNAGCDTVNRKGLALIPGTATTYPAQDWARHDAFKNQLDKDCRAPRKLIVKPGARVMLLVNLSVSGGLVNGSLGIVRDCHPDSVTVEFDNGRIEEIGLAEWSIKKGEDLMATREQIPLRLAWAVTIHKSQGMTLDKIEVHLGKCFAPGQAYVALSRARTSAGLFIRGENAIISAHPEAVQFYLDHTHKPE